jgi:hypothetical protein
MKKSILLSITILLLFLFVKCNSNSKWNPDEIKAVGKVVDTTYVWCGAVPNEENYSYRTGKWEFRNKNNILIAAGEYDVFINKFWDKGACEYEYLENSIDLNKWMFWNLKGNIIEPTDYEISLVDFKVKNNDSIDENLTPGYKL